MRNLFAAAGLLLLSAWTFRPVTWGANTVQCPDGSVCVSLGAGLDGGWVDGGPLQGFDGGIQDTDAGVCADGGLDCMACQGSCNVDAGIVWYPDGGPPTDGGFAYGGAASFSGNSDPVPANYIANFECCIGPLPTFVRANTTLQLQGSNQPRGPWINIDAGSNAGVQTIVGSGCAAIQTTLQSGVWPNESVNVSSSSDGGNLACTVTTQ